MSIFKFNHQDFSLSISTENFSSIFNKAKRYNAEDFLSEYKITSALDNNIDICFTDKIGQNEIEIENNNDSTIIKAPPIFFENHEYSVVIDFNDKTISNIKIFSPLKIIASKFFLYTEKQILTGTINFYNNIGKGKFVIRYAKKGENKEIVFSFEVFPTKLSYRKDLREIIDFINKEYPHLVLSYLRATFVEFTDFSINENDIVWWRIFEKLYDELIRTFKYIIEKPHYKVIKNERYVIGDKIKRWTPKLEEEFMIFRYLPWRKYRTLYYFLSTDNFENRFFKYVVIQSKK